MLDFLYTDLARTIVIILLLTSIVVSFIAQIKVKTTYSKYSQRDNAMGITGGQMAQMILQATDIDYVTISVTGGTLTDNFNPTTNVISLSQDVFYGRSLAAIGVAAHECGHVIQHDTKYLPIRLRSAMVPAVNFSSRFSTILIVVGLLINAAAQLPFGYYLAVLGVVLYSLATIFQLVTLPVELDASRRAMAQVGAICTPSADDKKGIRKVLTAAAMTYVAALFTSIMNLLRLVQMVGRRRD